MDIEEAFDLYKQGMSLRDIAKRYNCTHQNVSKVFRNNLDLGEYKEWQEQRRFVKKANTYKSRTYVCEWCGTNFHGKQGQRHCSLTCAGFSRRK